MSGEVKVLKPRNAMDRQLAKIEAAIVWDFSGQCVRENLDAKDRLAELAEQALAIGELDGATPTIKLRAIAAARDCILGAASIRTGTIIDRTIPTLSRSEVAAVLANLPAASAEVDADRAADPIAAERKAMREALRAICHGRAVSPDLTLLVANGDG